MKVSATELGILNASLQIDKEGKAKQYALAELTTAHAIFNKIKELTKENVFIDGEIELTTEEKAFLLKESDRAWDVFSSGAVLSIREKLK